MYEIARSRKFKSAYKKLTKPGRSDFDNAALEEIIGLLTVGKDLPEKYRDHILKGNLSEYKECHVTSNLLLVYEIDELNKIVTLSEIGTHSELFKR
jgi:mRNA interferase YafQ